MKKTLGHVDEPLKTVPAVALFGGIALYYAAPVAFRLRTAHTLGRERVVAALICLALIPLGTGWIHSWPSGSPRGWPRC